MYNQHAINILNHKHILFVRDPNLKNEKKSIQSPFNYFQYRRIGKFLYLLDTEFINELFDIMPKSIVITSNSKIPYKFNIEMLKDTSTVISKSLTDNPDCLEYPLNLDDENNVLEKFAKMYQGEEVIFKEEDLPVSQRIIQLLGLEESLNYSNFEYLRNKKDMIYGLNFQSFLQFLKFGAPRTFKIKTHKKEYNCNIFGVYSSKILSSLLEKDIFYYEYDYEDELDEFQLVCNIFNFVEIKITSDNMHILNEMINDFQITVLMDKISTFIDDFEKVSQKIDDEQTIVDTIEEVFDWLYKIKELTVETVMNYIIESDWIQTDENVQELSAFLLQVINNDSTYHSYISDLLIQLNDKANESNSLNILIPFIVQKLMSSFGDSLLNCSFIYNLFKRGIISKETLKTKFIKFFDNDDEKLNKKANRFGYDINDYRIDKNRKSSNLISWFYPEIIEIEEIKDKINFFEQNSNHAFIQRYFPNNVQEYYKMRDSGEPDDELTRALRYDDVDTLQSLLIKKSFLVESNKNNSSNNKESRLSKELLKVVVPFNLFEDFVPNGLTNYINYACAYGSLKCFKYLLLNHERVDQISFDLAVFGGNIEIIKIVSQNIKDDANSKKKFASFFNESKKEKFPAIIKHRNDIFDWIFQEKYKGKIVDDDLMYELLISTAKNGNAHALIEIIDEGINCINSSHEIINSCARNGFYLFTKLFINIFKTKKNEMFLDYSSSVYFGNLSIFKLYHENTKTRFDINSAMSIAIENNYTSIIHCFFNDLIDEFKIRQDFVFACLKSSVNANNNDLFNYLIEQFRKENPNFFKRFKKENELLSMSCLLSSPEITKTIIDLIIANDQDNDYTTPFFNAAISGKYETIKYFIDKKLFINYEKLSYQVKKLSSVSDEIFSLIIENADSESREIFLNTYLEQAIRKNNKKLIKYLFDQGANCDDCLFIAIEAHDIELVNLILEYKSSLINKRSKTGTVLYAAVLYNDLNLVKRLLKVPGIDPDGTESENLVPLIAAVYNMNFDIVNEILNFYEEHNFSETKQFDEALKTVLKVFPRNNPSNKLVGIDMCGSVPYYNTNYQMWGGYPIGDLSFVMKNKAKIILILKRLLDFKSIDPNCRFNNYTLLLYACENNEIEIVQMLLQLEKIDVNLCSLETGDSPLILSISKENLKIAELLINYPKTNINMRNYQKDSALTIAVNKNLENIVDLIIKNEKFNPEESNVNYAFFLSSEIIAKKLILSKSLDVNYEIEKECVKEEANSIEFKKSQLKYYLPDEEHRYITTLIDAINNNYKEKIDMIIHHSSFNKIKSQLKKSIFVSVEKNRLEIFQQLIKLMNSNVNIFNCNNESLLFVAVKYRSKDILSEILKNSDFDEKKSCFLRAFCETIINNNSESANIMNELYNYDKEHDHLIDFTKLLPNGKSFFTLIASTLLFQNEGDDCDDIDYVSKKDLNGVGDIVLFLLNNGVDPNIPDEDNFLPLEYAMLLNSYDFAHLLIQSNRIDFTQKVAIKEDFFILYENQYDDCLNPSESKTKSYLHIAARSKNSDILKEFITDKLIDINATDECDENVLMEAARFNRLENVQLLSQVDDLDYLHRNNEGNDTIEILLNIVDSFDEEPEVKTRDDYFNTLIKILISERNSEKNEGDNYAEEEQVSEWYSEDYD